MYARKQLLLLCVLCGHNQDPPPPSIIPLPLLSEEDKGRQKRSTVSEIYMHTNVGRSKGILEEVTLVSSLCERPVGFQRTFSLFYISVKFRVLNAFAVFYQMFSKENRSSSYKFSLFSKVCPDQFFLKRIFSTFLKGGCTVVQKTYHSQNRLRVSAIREQKMLKFLNLTYFFTLNFWRIRSNPKDRPCCGGGGGGA